MAYLRGIMHCIGTGVVMSVMSYDAYKAAFLSWNSIVTEDPRRLRDPSKIVLAPDVIVALRVLQKYYKLFILAHQPSITVEVSDSAQIAHFHEDVLQRLAHYGVQVEQVISYVKNSLHPFIEVAEERRLDLPGSLCISDRSQDIKLAGQVGARGIYVMSRNSTQTCPDLPPDSLIVVDIWDAVLHAMEMHLIQHRQPALSDIERAAEILREGGIVAFPTETVYGLGANALDPMAVARVFEIKRRPRFDPLIVHVADPRQVNTLVSQLPGQAQKLINLFWPGPLTIVLPKSDRVPDIVTAGLSTVAIRMPDHPVALTLIRRSGVPIAAPSANLFGHVSPTMAEHVYHQLGDAVDLVLNGGRCPIGIESTVISVSDDEAVLLRLGGLPVEELERVIGPVQRHIRTQASPKSPGQLPHHYAPRTPLVLRDRNAPELTRRCGLLSFTEPTSAEGFVAVEVLSKSGDLREAAANLFVALHRLDSMQLELIVAELVPEVGLGQAINDRLRRAAHKGGIGSTGSREVSDESRA